MKFDAKFYAFQKLAKLAEILLPNVRHYSAEQVDALHEYARTMAKDLTSGQYEYTPRNQ